MVKEQTLISSHLPVKLVYYEEFTRIDEAFKRKQIQKMEQGQKIALIKGDIENLKKLSKSKSLTKTKDGEFDRTILWRIPKWLFLILS